MTNPDLDSLKEQVTRIEQRVDEITALLQGKDGKLGIVAKTNVIWSVQVWILCTMSAGFGAVAYATIQFLWRLADK